MNDLSEIHRNLRKTIAVFDEVCTNHSIKYSLAYGTLLGAVRHKGFIPWDDDLDVLMKREEYNKLLKISSQIFEIEYYGWVPRWKYLDPEYENYNYIDIFIIDNASKTHTKRILKLLILRFLQGTIKDQINWNKYSLKGKILSYLPFLVGKYLPMKYKLDLFNRISQNDNRKETEFLCAFNSEYKYMNLYFRKEIFVEVIQMPFDGLLLPCIKGYHEYLKIIYGNYQQLPPLIERKPSHLTM